MSRPYGPIQLTAGVMASVDVDAGAAFCVIENSSINLDLAVSFQVNAPAQATYVSGFPWNGYIQAGGSKRLTLPPNDGRWTGRIWLYPISVSVYSAQTGTGSSYSRAIVTTFGTNEEPQDFQGVIRGLDLTSQPRIVNLPMAVQVPRYATITMGTTPQSETLANVQDTGVIGVTYNPATATGQLKVFLYAITVHPLTVGSCKFGLYLTGYDAGSTALKIATPALWRPRVSKAGYFGPESSLTLAFPEPVVVGYGAAIGTEATGRIGWIFLGGDGGMQVDISLLISFDSSRTSWPNTYGIPSYTETF